ncbi:hypothetical protein VTO73DRAFT_13686 [Trametes versicolor]
MSYPEYNPPSRQYNMMYPYSEHDIRHAQVVAEDECWERNGWAMPHDTSPSHVGGYALAAGVPQHLVRTERHVSLPIPRLTLVPQVPFRGPSNHDVAEGVEIEFGTVNGGHVSLAQALHGHVDELVEKDAIAFPKGTVSSKVSLRIQFEEYQPFHHRQVMALRSTNLADSISRGKLATTIAKDTSSYLKNEKTLNVGGRTFSFEQVFLARLRRVSKGSWQPEFYVWL